MIGWTRADALSSKLPTESNSSANAQPMGTQSPASGRFRFLVPSVSDVVFIAILAGLSCGALGRILLRDAGIGWHIRNGQLMLSTHTITRTDPFSATIHGGTWYAWEWLYDVMIAVIHFTLGLDGVVFFSAAVIAATFVLTLHFAIRRGANLVVVIFLLLLSLGASSVHFLARPHVFSWLLTVVWFEVLDSAATSDGKRTLALFCLPLLMVLWVNLHGGYVLAFVLLAIYLVDGGIRSFAAPGQLDQTRTWLKQLGLVTLLSFTASFVNPYGYHLHVHVYRYLSDRYLMDRISEFLSPDFHIPAQQCFAVLLLVTIVVLTSARRGLTPARLLVVLFAAYSGLYATRSLPTSSILITLIIAPMFSQSVVDAAGNSRIMPLLRRCFSRLHFFGARMGNLELNFSDHFWLVVIFLLGLWACMYDGRIGSAQFIDAYFSEKRFPVEAVNFIYKQKIREPIFSIDYWGGYLIYSLYPQTKVVVDDRHDLYGDEFIKDYLKVTLVQPGWDRILEQQHVDWVLMPEGSSLANMLRLKSNWKVIHEDSTAVLFQRSVT